MALFSWNKPADAVAAQQQTENQVTPAPAPTLAETVAAVMKEMMPLMQQARTPEPASAPPPVIEDDDISPEERQRIQRIASDVTNTIVGPSASIMNMVMPDYARGVAVGKLTPGQKMIYDKYKHEVDEGVNLASQTNPILRNVPQVHENAIRLVIGSHSDEIERLVLEHLQPEELPVRLRPPSTTTGAEGSGEPPTNNEKEFMAFFATRSRAKDWDNVDTVRYYDSIKPGFLSDMVAEHKERQRGKQSS